MLNTPIERPAAVTIFRLPGGRSAARPTTYRAIGSIRTFRRHSRLPYPGGRASPAGPRRGGGTGCEGVVVGDRRLPVPLRERHDGHGAVIAVPAGARPHAGPRGARP